MSRYVIWPVNTMRPMFNDPSGLRRTADVCRILEDVEDDKERRSLWLERVKHWEGSSPYRPPHLEASFRMTERQKVTMAKLLAVIETEFTQSLGRSVTEHMPRVRLRARAGEPNWNAEIGGDIGISVFGAFLVTLDRVKAMYDLDDDAREDLISGKR